MLDKALCDFVGFGEDKYPTENPDLILTMYGEAMLVRVQKIMNAFEAELTNNPNLEIAEALRVTTSKISVIFPEIGVAGLDALVWAFSYWFK